MLQLMLIGVLLTHETGGRVECQATSLQGKARATVERPIQLGAARLQFVVDGPMTDLEEHDLKQHLLNAAQAVAVYYGRFPVKSAEVVVVVSPGKRGVLEGTTWGDRGGFPAVTRLRVGQQTTSKELADDWIATHELVHMSLASLPDEQHWLEEGIATYVEPIARVQAGQLTSQRIWLDMVNGMVHGEPQAGDRGLNQTHSWGRTYWGGALFCLVADVKIRQQTDNTRGLQDALSAIVNAGGTIDKDWPVERLLVIGDRATGTSVLEDLYAQWSAAPVTVDLKDLWEQLGVNVSNGSVSFSEGAPLAKIRIAITAVPRR